LQANLRDPDHERSQYKELPMTVNKTNRSHRIAYMVFLLVLAVALTTALVLAGERGSASEKHAQHSPENRTPFAQFFAGDTGC
jgi:hypothetical protein